MVGINIMGKRQIKRWLIGIIVTIILGTPGAFLACFNVYERIKENTFYKNASNSTENNANQSIRIHILTGETKEISEYIPLIITLDKILREDSKYLIYGTFNDGYDTVPFNRKGQGESIEIPNFIIQIMKIRDDYADFRIVQSE
ncbi:MAG: hypothetical protein LBE13_01490 [Bacteroidales bacterium]|jgi:hypothetical protein|nr:hypothetical protein [Bacteroidales bacterium]